LHDLVLSEKRKKFTPRKSRKSRKIPGKGGWTKKQKLDGSEGQKQKLGKQKAEIARPVDGNPGGGGLKR
jgi:hypothetical protein